MMHQIRSAFYEAEKARPYKMNPEIIKATTPPGGDWTCVAPEGAICRSVVWGRQEVAYVNPSGDIGDVVEGQIAMAMRALPTMDAALRAIIVLAGNPANAPLIAELAESVIAFVELPAPAIKQPEEEEEPDESSE
jgi:hypothetical protein